MYIFFLLVFFMLYGLFLDIYNNHYVKFIVVSNNNKKLKIHSNPVSLGKAIEIKNNLRTQHNYQTVSGFSIKKDVLIIKYVRFR